MVRRVIMRTDLSVGDLVEIPRSSVGHLRKILPFPDGGMGVIVEMKNTSIFPGSREGILCKILVDGSLYHVWSEDLKIIDSPNQVD